MLLHARQVVAEELSDVSSGAGDFVPLYFDVHRILLLPLADELLLLAPQLLAAVRRAVALLPERRARRARLLRLGTLRLEPLRQSERADGVKIIPPRMSWVIALAPYSQTL